jgi:hypothetical protein
MTPQEEMELLNELVEVFERRFTQLEPNEQVRIWKYLQDRYITHANKRREEAKK